MAFNFESRQRSRRSVETLRDKERKTQEILSGMESAQSSAELKKLIPLLIDRLEKDFGIRFTDDITSLYKEMQEKRFLVRLENIRRVVEGVYEKRGFKIGDKEDHYANAVVPENEGLRIAFSEGEAPGPVRFLVGFDVKSAIGFDPNGLEVSDIETDESDLRDTAKRRALLRHVSGNLEPENIHHFIMRIPRAAFPEERMTEEEAKNKGGFIFRGARLR
ncbi:MAG: hypothetical protein AAB617_02335 [Patescibacteria group bacterium]